LFLQHYVLRPLRLLVCSRCRSSLQRSFFMESCDPGTEILEPMLALVHERRVASTNVLLHPYLRDVRSTSFPASYAKTTCLTSLASWITSVFASVTPAVTRDGNMPRYPTIPKSGPSCAPTKFYVDISLFSIIFGCQNNQFQLLCTPLQTFIGSYYVVVLK
jgi:hypothetical protein